MQEARPSVFRDIWKHSKRLKFFVPSRRKPFTKEHGELGAMLIQVLEKEGGGVADLVRLHVEREVEALKAREEAK